MGLPVFAAASLIKSAAGLIPNKKDPQRIATAQANLVKALAGDASALQALKDQAAGSATAVGKEAARRALESYNANTPHFVAPEPSALQQQVGATVNAVRNDLAQGIQNIGAGAATAASNAVGGDGNQPRITLPVSIPFTPTQLLIMAGVAGAILYFSRR